MFIAGVGTAAPPYRYAQRECWEALQQARQFQELTPRSRALLRKVLTASNGIATRHLALERLEEAFVLTPDALHARFRQHAPALATQAAKRALVDAVLSVDQVDALVISTCTGYLCPGLSSYVGERLGVRPEVLGLDLVGQGCVAALPNLRTAEALLAAKRCRYVLSICVEVCSAAFYLDNDPGVLISACLFGDGAGAAVLAHEPRGQRRLEWKQSTALLQPKDRDLLRFEQTRGMLRNILSPQVPLLAAKYASHVFQQALVQAGLQPADINGWVLHPGGREVLTALRLGLGLNEEDLRWSAAVLREFGNLSSASLFFVLQQAMAERAPGGYWWLSSFGAGFSCQGAMLAVDV